MSDIATQNTPFAAALATQAKAYFEPMQAQLGNFMQRADQMLAQVCAQGNANAANPNMSAQRVVPGMPGGCGSCGGGCANGQCSFGGGSGGGGPEFYGAGRPGGPPAIPQQPGGPPVMVVPGCYSECDGIDPCLYAFLLEARKRFDEWSWLELMKREIDIVHLDTNVGDGVVYQVPAQPLAANQQAILVQNAAQQLPWQPGLIKLNADWNGTKAPSLVTINFWSGISGITNIADPTTAGLIQIGSSYKLSDFECAQDCYLAPWPKLFGCGTNAIPDTRRVYVEVRVGAVGAATLSSYSVTVLKRRTAQCDKWTSIYKGCNK
jgi:hypothetical protein